MKNLLSIIAALGLLALPALGQLTPLNITPAISNGTVFIGSSNATTTFAGTTNVIVDIYQGKGIGFSADIVSPVANISNVSFVVVASMDGTNYCTTPSFTWIWPCAGATRTTYATNWPASTVDNFMKMKLYSIGSTNSLTNFYCTNIIWARRY